MGWVGVGALVATTCFILYRYIPSNCWRTQSPEPSSAPRLRRESLGCHKAAESTERDTKNESDQAPTGSRPNDETDDPQTTPKAQAVTAPSSAVPTLSLNGAGDAHIEDHCNGSISSQTSRQSAGVVDRKLDSQAAPSTGAAARTSALMPPPPAPRKRPSTTTPLPPTIQQQQQPQRSQPPTGPGSIPYPPRPPPSTTTNSRALRPPPSAAASLRVPQANTGSGSRLTSSSLSPVQVTYKPTNNNSKSSRKVVLEPGFSPLDWAALTSNPQNRLRGANLPPTLIRVTPSMLKAQNGRKGTDAWTSYMGKVYNITPYLPFHPGGKGELLRGAGKDSGQLFMEVHPWVNWDAILGECLVGILVSESQEGQTNRLDEMD